MAATVVVNFKMGGADALQNSIRSVSQSATRIAVTEATKRTRAEQQASKARVNVEKEAAKTIAAVNKDLARDVARLGKESADVAKAAAKARVQAEKEANRQIIADVRAVEKEKQAAAARVARMGRSTAKAEGNVMGGAAHGFRRGVGVLGAGAGLVGGAIGTAGILEAVRSSMALESQIASVAADASENGVTFDQKAMTKRAQGVASSTGISASDVAAGLEEATAHGGGKAGLEAFAQNLERIGELSLASGTKMEDLASISAALTNSQITGAEDQMSIMRDLNAAAKAGNINLRELGPGIAQIMGSMKAGGFDVKDAARQAGALAQVAMGGGGAGAADSVTAARNFFNDIAKQEKDLRGMGVKTTAADGKTRVDPLTQFKQMMKITGGDVTKINAHGQMFGMQSQPLVGALMQAYMGKNTDLKDKNGKVLSGDAGLDALIKKFAGAVMTDSDVVRDAAIKRATAENQYNRALADFQAKVGTDLLPALTKALPQFAQLAGVVATLVSAFADSPGIMAGAFVGINVAAGVLESSLGALAANAGASGAATAVQKLGVAALVGAGAFAATWAVLTHYGKESDKAEKDRRKTEVAKVDDLLKKVDNGTATDADRMSLDMIQKDNEKRANTTFTERLFQDGPMDALRNEDDRAEAKQLAWVINHNKRNKPNDMAPSDGTFGPVAPPKAEQAPPGADKPLEAGAIAAAIASSLQGLRVEVSNLDKFPSGRDPTRRPITGGLDFE